MTTMAIQQRTLFDEAGNDYQPRPAPLFQPRKIVLAKGSVTTPARRRLADSILAVYPKAEVIEQPTVPHNKVNIQADDPLDLHYKGHRVLVLGEHKSAVGQSDEEGNTCPNFWHFSPYGFCPYGCSFCYLSGTQGCGSPLDQGLRQPR